MNANLANHASSVVIGVLWSILTVISPPARAAESPAVAWQAGQVVGDAAKTLGHEGWLMIRSQARLEQVREQLGKLGWQRSVERPDPLGGLDWSKNMVVGYYAFGDPGDKYTVGKCGQADGRATLGLLREYVIHKPPLEAKYVCNFILVVIPVTKEVDLTISRWTGQEKAVPEQVRRLTTNGTDIVDGLTGSIRVEKAEVKAGDDIKVEFSLIWTDVWEGKEIEQKPGRFPIYVWDGKYSHGYRNHAFLVETPDGKSQFLRPPVIEAWLKNVPHPEAIAEGKPYILPGWVETWKTLKGLGLDTTKPGTYRITGVYMEEASETDGMAGRKEDGGKFKMWGGNIATNTVEVVVK